MVEWGVAARTFAIDQLIGEAVGAGADTVLNIGAGLDTRPYRLALPANLRWVELDFPHLIDSKSSLLDNYKPVCRLERIGLDISNRALRTEILGRYGSSSNNSLILTEGVISYFSNEAVEILARDLFDIEVFRSWIQDFDNAGKRGMPRGWAKRLAAVPVLFEPKDWFEFFDQFGWKPSRIITNLQASELTARPYPLDLPHGLIMRALPREWQRKILSLSGAVMLRK